MKKYFTAFQMTQSMFCSIPFPCRQWDENSRPYMMFFLPVVGLEIGIFWYLLDQIAVCFQLPSLIYALLMCAWPYISNGFMHLDGFMDVTDAVYSWRDLEKRRQILKDSHVGSFSVVWCIFLVLAGFAAFGATTAAESKECLLLIPVISRCCSALAVMNLKPMSISQYAGTKAYPKWHTVIIILFLILSIGGSFTVLGKYALPFLGVVIGYGAALRKAYQSLQGMNGDISGFCICISELCGILVLAML